VASVLICCADRERFKTSCQWPRGIRIILFPRDSDETPRDLCENVSLNQPERMNAQWNASIKAQDLLELKFLNIVNH